LGFSCLVSLYLVRIILGTYMFLSLKFIRSSLDLSYKNQDISKFFYVIMLTQFHYLFYSSRPLPNTYALVVVNFGIGYWIWGKIEIWISLLAATTILLWCDTIVLCIGMVLCEIQKILDFKVLKKTIIWGAITSVVCIVSTILIDS